MRPPKQPQLKTVSQVTKLVHGSYQVVLVVAPRYPEKSCSVEYAQGRTTWLAADLSMMVRNADVQYIFGRAGIRVMFNINKLTEVDSFMLRLTGVLQRADTHSDSGTFCVGGIVGPTAELSVLSESSLQQMALLKLDTSRKLESGIDVFVCDDTSAIRIDSALPGSEPMGKLFNAKGVVVPDQALHRPPV